VRRRALTSAPALVDKTSWLVCNESVSALVICGLLLISHDKQQKSGIVSEFVPLLSQ
jgi:hypothetical protein